MSPRDFEQDVVEPTARAIEGIRRDAQPRRWHYACRCHAAAKLAEMGLTAEAVEVHLGGDVTCVARGDV